MLVRMLWFAFSSFIFVDRLQLQVVKHPLWACCDLLSVLLFLWIDYNLTAHQLSYTMLWFAFSSFIFVDRLQLMKCRDLIMKSCDLLSVLLFLWIDYNFIFLNKKTMWLWFAFSSFIFVDRLQPSVKKCVMWTSCDLLSVLLFLWIDYNCSRIFKRISRVVICFQFFYFCG